MSPENFVYWLNGFLEIGGPTALNPIQVQIIKDHLDLVLDKKTPIRLVLPASDSELVPLPLPLPRHNHNGNMC